jgi:uncharacterized protein (TIGR02099 family)
LIDKTFKWLKHLWLFFAVTLFIIALILSAARFASTEVNNYKAQLIEWIAAEHDIKVSVDDISAGVDFSGLVLTLKNVSFVDAPVLPFELKLEHLFFHLDFINSIKNRELVFNDISLKGGDLLLKPSYHLDQSSEENSSNVILVSLKTIFLSRLNSFSIKNSRLRFTDHLYQQKTIYIQDLSWFNEGERHQGIGKASLSNNSDKNTLEFIIDITGDPDGENEQLITHLYAHAEDLNVIEYLQPQINPLAQLKTANISFKLWSQFDSNGPKNLQFEWGESEIAWSLLDRYHDWNINKGLLQFSYQDKNWLFDSYDLDIEYNHIPWADINLSGLGIGGKSGEFNFKGVNLNSVVPFALLFSNLPEMDIKRVHQLEIGGELKQIGLEVEQPGELSLSAEINAFNNQAVGVIPGLKSANVNIKSSKKSGSANIYLLTQSVEFDEQLTRALPVKKGILNLNWISKDSGFEITSKKSLLETEDLKGEAQFSLFFPNEKSIDRSPFLSLYSTFSVKDIEKAQYYFPIRAMGEDVYNYLQPSIKKGTMKNAKILWYGALADYPYAQKEGVFQAFVPLKNAQYDFYPEWEGLTSLDLDLLFENDHLLMTANKAKLGEATLKTLTGKIDHLTVDGVITIKAEIEDDAQLISEYLIRSPLKESVGEALKVISIQNSVRGKLTLAIPFSHDNGSLDVSGKINLTGNDVDIKLGDKLSIPLKQVKGVLNLVNSEITATGLSATLFKQPLDLSVKTRQLKETYQAKVDFSGRWDAAALSVYHSELSLLKLSGLLDWQGDLLFKQSSKGGYNFNVNLHSPLQGTKVDLPSPYNKHVFQTWPSIININGNQTSAKWDAKVTDKVKWLGKINYSKETVSIPYSYIGIGSDQGLPIDNTKQIIRINEESASLTDWTPIILELLNSNATSKNDSVNDTKPLFDVDNIYVDIKQSDFFEKSIFNFSSDILHDDNFWNINIKADDLAANVEYRKGIPDRFDVQVDNMDFQLFNFDRAINTFFKQNHSSLPEVSDNLREDYPEVFLDCTHCIYKNMNFSTLTAHVFPSQSRYNIDYFKLGGDEYFTKISGVWDQRRTNIIIDSKVDSEESLINRLGYVSPVIFKEAEVSGALNWVGAPWQFNFESLNGAFSSVLENGMITEVDDNGARLLGFLSLDGIRRSLNLEFDNVFSKGLGFDIMSSSANINNGIIKNEDYYLDGSAGKISGGGLVDLPNLNVNYHFSYSPAVTSSLPVLAAFTINPLTGAAVLMLTKLLEPVVDTIVRVDFSVKGSLLDPIVKIESREKGKVKLQNSAVLEAMEDKQLSQGTTDEQ